MNSGRIIEFLVALVLVVSAVLLVNPFELWMPDMMYMTVLAVVVAAFGVIAAFMVKERAGDERDESHRSFAGRAAFLVGSGILVIGIVAQTFSHTLDPWLVAALAGMVLAKVAVRRWSESNR
jgi:peptidoglycan/LPS O-acetylase OafA/YrhL